MLEIIRDSNGIIQAVCEYYVVDVNGAYSSVGEWVWIEQMEFSSSVNGHGLGYVKQFIKNITAQVPWAKYGYFDRKKYGGRIRLYAREKWLSFAK